MMPMRRLFALGVPTDCSGSGLARRADNSEPRPDFAFGLKPGSRSPCSLQISQRPYPSAPVSSASKKKSNIADQCASDRAVILSYFTRALSSSSSLP